MCFGRTSHSHSSLPRSDLGALHLSIVSLAEWVVFTLDLLRSLIHARTNSFDEHQLRVHFAMQILSFLQLLAYPSETKGLNLSSFYQAWTNHHDLVLSIDSVSDTDKRLSIFLPEDRFVQGPSILGLRFLRCIVAQNRACTRFSKVLPQSKLAQAIRRFRTTPVISITVEPGSTEASVPTEEEVPSSTDRTGQRHQSSHPVCEYLSKLSCVTLT